MAIYRICEDYRHYLNFVEDATDIEEKLGYHYPFHIDRRPVPYAHLWKEPIKMTFYYGNYSKTKTIPDINENGGRIYLSEQAHDAFHDLMKDSGEFLPVTHEQGTGYIFNPLLSTEDVDGVDEVFHDEHGNMVGFKFHEDRLDDLFIFRTAVDTHLGIFCHEGFKECVENSDFKGVRFTKHYGDFFKITRGMFD